MVQDCTTHTCTLQLAQNKCFVFLYSSQVLERQASSVLYDPNTDSLLLYRGEVKVIVDLDKWDVKLWDFEDAG